MKYFVSLRILCITDIGHRGSNITYAIICWTLSKWNQKPTIYGPKQDDEHPSPHHYMSQACVAGGFWVWFLFLARIYTAACRSNEKTVGERARKREREREKKPSQLTPWDFWNAPSSLVKGEIWLACDVTCLEVWHLSKTTVTLMVCSVHVHVWMDFV